MTHSFITFIIEQLKAEIILSIPLKSEEYSIRKKRWQGGFDSLERSGESAQCSIKRIHR